MSKLKSSHYAHTWFRTGGRPSVLNYGLKTAVVGLRLELMGVIFMRNEFALCKISCGQAEKF